MVICAALAGRKKRPECAAQIGADLRSCGGTLRTDIVRGQAMSACRSRLPDSPPALGTCDSRTRRAAELLGHGSRGRDAPSAHWLLCRPPRRPLLLTPSPVAPGNAESESRR